MKDWAIDAGERAVRAFAAAVLSTLVVGDGFDAFHVHWPAALGVGLGGAIVSILTSLAALKLGNQGTASLTTATVTNDYCSAVVRGKHEAGLSNGPAV